MNPFRIALANFRFPATPEESVTLAEQAIAQASIERAWAAVAAAAAKANVAVVLGTERVIEGTLLATALVIDRDGTIAGFQDKSNSTHPRKVLTRPVPVGGFSRPVQ